MDKLFVKEIVQAIQNQDAVTRRFDKAIEEFNSSYTVCSLDTYTRKMLYKLIEIQLGAEFIEFLDWWLYDRESPKIMYDVENNKTDISKLDDFVDYCFDKNVIDKK